MKTFKTYYIIFLFMLTPIVTLLAQTRSVNPLDDRYSPTENSVFNSSKAKNKIVNGPQKDLLLTIRYLPFELLRGNIHAEGEFNLGGSSCNLLGGLGYHVSTDKIAGTSDFEDYSSYSSLFSPSSDVPFQYIMSSGEMTSGGILVSAGIKGYITGLPGLWSYNSGSYAGGDPFDDLYLYFRYTHFGATYKSPTAYYGTPLQSTSKYLINTNLLTVGFGFSVISRNALVLQHDFYFGFGANMSKHSNYALQSQEVYNTQTSSYETHYNYMLDGKKSEVIFGALNFGYAIGFGL